MSKFGFQLKKFFKVAKKHSDADLREIGMFALSSVTTITPVDHGTAKGNWFVGVNAIDRSVDEDRRVGTAISEGRAVINGFRSGATLNISNSLPYINRLEHGYSNQAKSGMVKVTLPRVKLFIEKKSKKV